MPFWVWTKNTSFSPAQGFFSPILCPKKFPSTYLPPPTSLTSFPAHLMARAQESSRAWVAQSFQETWDTRLEEKKGKLLPFFTFFFLPLWFFFFCGFFSFYLSKRRRRQWLLSFSFIFWFMFEVKKVTTQACHGLLFFSLLAIVTFFFLLVLLQKRWR
jgi:hypothetical protein